MSTASSSPVPDRSVGSHGDDFPLTRVRRNLFGTPDPETTLQFLKAELERQQRCDARRWTFDFVAEKPLPKIGDHFYDWQPTTPHLPTVVMEDDRHFRLIVEDSDSEDSAINRCQTQITDFMRKRKFSVPLKPPEQNAKQPSPEDPGPSLTKSIRPSSPRS